MRAMVWLLVLGALGCGGSSDSGVTPSGGDTATATEGGVLEDSAVATDTAVTDTTFTETGAETSTEAGADRDGDGLDDAYEDKIAAEYLPFLSFDPTDGCPRAIIVFRLYPHPDAPKTRLHMIVDTLLEKDCGASGHVGDNEVFGMTIDPSKPAPAGILAVRAISHQGTTCEAITNCGSCGGLEKCMTATRRGAAYPVVFYSKDKHGSYMQESKCDNACFFTNFCTLAPTPTEPKMINAGEPGKPMVNDLTAAGMITAAAGWTEMSVFKYDPWGPMQFGKAGKVSEDLVDKAFLTVACP